MAGGLFGLHLWARVLIYLEEMDYGLLHWLMSRDDFCCCGAFSCFESSKGVMSKAAGILMQKLGVIGHSVWFSAFSRDFALQVDLHRCGKVCLEP